MCGGSLTTRPAATRARTAKAFSTARRSATGNSWSGTPQPWRRVLLSEDYTFRCLKGGANGSTRIVLESYKGHEESARSAMPRTRGIGRHSLDLSSFGTTCMCMVEVLIGTHLSHNASRIRDQQAA